MKHLRDISIALGLVVSFGSLLIRCKDGTKEANEAPLTFTSVQAINLTGEDRLNSLVTLRWWGTDPDGVVKGYEFSFDEETWYFTEEQDSTFLFSINAGSDTVDIDFWVRAIDLEDVVDPTPAYLSIPLKNTPPEINFQRDLIPTDTSFNLVTLLWEATDLDGFETIENIELKLNEGDWVSISPGRSLAAVVPTDPNANGSTGARLYYDDASEGPEMDDLRLNNLNSIFVRAIDIAGSYSQEDTITDLFIRGKTEDVLLIGANSSKPDAFYQSNLSSNGFAVDFIDYVRDDAVNQPPVWYPTFQLLLEQYETVVMYSNDVNFTNVQTNAEDIVLEYASTSIQNYIDAGGKLFLSTSFPNAFSTGSSLFGILPIDSLSTADGQARLPIDSLAVAEAAGYPDLLCNTFISGLDPIYPSSDAEIIYSAQLTKNNGWDGPNTVGVRRKLNGNTNFVFFSVELHKINGDPSAMSNLFDKVMNDEFNW
jgi:hypothetical protein